MCHKNLKPVKYIGNERKKETTFTFLFRFTEQFFIDKYHPNGFPMWQPRGKGKKESSVILSINRDREYKERNSVKILSNI